MSHSGDVIPAKSLLGFILVVDGWLAEEDDIVMIQVEKVEVVRKENVVHF